MRGPGKTKGPLPWRAYRVGLYLLVLLAGLGGAVQGQSPQGTSPPLVYQVDIDGAISPGTLGLLQHAITAAEANRAAALILRIDTPGGLLSTTRDMVSAIAGSQVPVIGYVGPSGASATSAGAFILLSTHIAAMNSGTNVGAASPVSGGGGDIEGTMGEKVMNDTRAFMRSIASSRKRNATVAEGFVTDADSVTADEAREAGVIDLVVADFSQLVDAVDGRELQFHGQSLTLALGDAEVKQVEPRLIDRLLQYVAHPQIAHMLISLGFLAIFIEILSPGLAAPGIFGAMAVILGLVGIQTLPVNAGFLGLLIMGITLMVAEYFVAGLGILGIGGAIAFILGSINLFDAPLSPEHENTIIAVSVGVSAAMLLTTFLLARSLISKSGKHKRMKGKLGEAMVSFDKSGHVLVDQERWPADTLEALEHGDPVVVVGTVEDNRLVVKKAVETNRDPST